MFVRKHRKRKLNYLRFTGPFLFSIAVLVVLNYFVTGYLQKSELKQSVKKIPMLSFLFLLKRMVLRSPFIWIMNIRNTGKSPQPNFSYQTVPVARIFLIFILLKMSF